jgi:hypothetical protein
MLRSKLAFADRERPLQKRNRSLRLAVGAQHRRQVLQHAGNHEAIGRQRLRDRERTLERSRALPQQLLSVVEVGQILVRLEELPGRISVLDTRRSDAAQEIAFLGFRGFDVWRRRARLHVLRRRDLRIPDFNRQERAGKGGNKSNRA